MMNNKQLADTFTLIANLLEIKGEIIYKTLAYRKAADSFLSLGREASEYWKEGKLKEIPGVGSAIAEKVDELLSTGKLEFLEKLKKEIPVGLVEWLPIPGLGPKRAALIWKELNITTLPELEAAAKEGRLRNLPGMGAKSEAAIIEGIASLSRRSTRLPLGRAYPLAQELCEQLKKVKGVVDAQPAGSLRRMRSTVGDLDILVASKDPQAVMDAFVKLPRVHRVLGRGDTKSSIEFNDGMRAQLWVHPPEKFGTALVYATGSKDHNVRLREIALSKGLSLSEHSFLKKDDTELFCESEEEVYKTLGLPWIPPELREDHGEIQAAKAGKLPKLIQLKNIKADLQTHSTWSDGKLSMLEMARAAAKRGIKVIAFTDHSISLGVTGGLSMEAHKKQAAEIKKIQKQLGDSILVLHATEVEIKADGSLDYPDEFLASLDLVVASLHTGLRQPREKVMQRTLNAIRNPHVDIIGHPTGRLLYPEREGADLDMDEVLKAAAESGVALEINAHPSRLDLDDVPTRRAKELGIPLSINTDGHSEEDLDLLFYGVAIGRRAWLEPKDVINCWPTDKLLKWLKKRGK
ncbi:MAG: DNA polymerase/3'-5' exonuclease PolX [Chloroflexota bacterium]